MEESSENKTQFHNSDQPNPENDIVAQNPQSGKTQDFVKPQPSIEPETTPLSSVDSPEEIDEEEIVDAMNKKHEEYGREKGEDDDLEYKNALDEDIRQVIYQESLNEAVMNLALDEEYRNGYGGYGGNEESSYLGGVGVDESGIGMGMGHMGYGIGVNGDGWEESDGERGRNGNVGAMQGQYGNEGVEREEADGDGNFGAEENSGFGGSRNHYKKQFQYPIRIDAEDCAFYMKTGNCKYGMNCKFNHPPKWRNQVELGS